MHQNSHFELKNRTIFWGGRPLLQWEGTPPPHILQPSVVTVGLLNSSSLTIICQPPARPDSIYVVLIVKNSAHFRKVIEYLFGRCLGVIQGHWQYHLPLDHIRLSIRLFKMAVAAIMDFLNL